MKDSDALSHLAIDLHFAKREIDCLKAEISILKKERKPMTPKEIIEIFSSMLDGMCNCTTRSALEHAIVVLKEKDAKEPDILIMP